MRFGIGADEWRGLKASRESCQTAGLARRTGGSSIADGMKRDRRGLTSAGFRSKRRRGMRGCGSLWRHCEPGCGPAAVSQQRWCWVSVPETGNAAGTHPFRPSARVTGSTPYSETLANLFGFPSSLQRSEDIAYLYVTDDRQKLLGVVALRVDGRITPGIGINGTVPGPLLRLREGETVRLRVSNADGTAGLLAAMPPVPAADVSGAGLPGPIGTLVVDGGVSMARG